MSKTISMTGNPPDIDGTIADGAESLKQRIHQAFKFRLGEWFMRTDQGIDYDVIFSHQVNFDQVSQVLISVIVEEGKDEVLSVDNVLYEHDNNTRQFIFTCDVETIYGIIHLREDF